MLPFDIVQAQRPGDRIQHGFGEVQGAPLFQAHVVVDADSGELRELLSALPGNAVPTAVVRQAEFLGPPAGPPGA